MKPKHVKVAEGEVRNEHWRTLTNREKIEDLDRRLGKDVGAKRQREKLTTK